jgi:hypothetical protein
MVHNSYILFILLFLTSFVQKGKTFTFRKPSTLHSMTLLKQTSCDDLHLYPKGVPQSLSSSSLHMVPRWANPVSSHLPSILSPHQRHVSRDSFLSNLLPKVRISTALRVANLFRNSSPSASVRNLSIQVASISQASLQLVALARLYQVVGLRSGSASTSASTSRAPGRVMRWWQIPIELLLLGGGGGQEALRVYRGLAVNNFARDLSGWVRLLAEKPFQIGELNE